MSTKLGQFGQRRLNGIIMISLSYAAAIIAWELVVDRMRLPETVLPKPSAVAGEFVSHAGSLLLGRGTLGTLYSVVTGFLVGALFGVGVAFALVLSPSVRRILYPGLLFFTAIPKSALAPVFLIWVGYGSESRILLTFIITFFPVTIETAIGLIDVEPEHIELMRSMRASTGTILKKIRFKNALPRFFGGLRIGITFAVIGAIIGEFISSAVPGDSLGWLITAANYQLRLSLSFASFIILGFMTLALFYTVVLVEKLVIPWHVERKRVGITV